MSKAVDDLETLELLGSTQWGLVTSSQAQAAGVARMRLSRLVSRGTLRRVRHGVYALPSAGGGPRQDVQAAWLATDSKPAGAHPQVVVSGQSAAAVHGLGDVIPSVHEFSTPVRRQSTLKDVRYRVRDLPAADLTLVDGLPVTTVTRCVADLASGGTDQEHLAAVVRDAHTAGTPAYALADALEPAAAVAGHPDGQTYVRALLDLAGYEPDPVQIPALSDAAMQQVSQTVLQAIAPQLRETMRLMAEQLTGSARVQVPPAVTEQMLAALAPAIEGARLGVAPLAASAVAPMTPTITSLFPATEALQASLGLTLPTSTIANLSNLVSGRLASAPRQLPPSQPLTGSDERAPRGEDGDDDAAEPAGARPAPAVARREAEHGGETPRSPV